VHERAGGGRRAAVGGRVLEERKGHMLGHLDQCLISGCAGCTGCRAGVVLQLVAAGSGHGEAVWLLRGAALGWLKRGPCLGPGGGSDGGGCREWCAAHGLTGRLHLLSTSILGCQAHVPGC
jgi:hypothetical protein